MNINQTMYNALNLGEKWFITTKRQSIYHAGQSLKESFFAYHI
jgi:hypothetical protein